MTLAVTNGTNDKPAASQALVNALSTVAGLEGQLFIGYPIVPTPEGRRRIDALLVAPSYGMVLFDLIEGTTPGDFRARQDDSANTLDARLRTYRGLTARRKLVVQIAALSFAPAIARPETLSSPEYPLANADTLASELTNLVWSEPDRAALELALSAVENISTIRQARARRSLTRLDSRGAKLKKLEESIATLDNMQSRAVVETVDGVQRIRGLAGSGKTIVLALKAAYLHTQHPDWRIAVTFNTRSLKDQFRRLINSFAIEQAGEEPDWQSLRILNAWGAPGGLERDGVYHEFCRSHDVRYFDFRTAHATFGPRREFASVCEQALTEAADLKPIYDAILVDEAQDFPPAFLRLCYEMLGPKRRLVYAYDELQTLAGGSMPAPEEIFGEDSEGRPRVRLLNEEPLAPRRDIILEKCYRNSRPVLVTAHALGFGVYRTPPRSSATGLVQMFDQPQLWTDIGYRIRSGELEAGSEVVLYRPEHSSPVFLENHSPIDDQVSFLRFESEAEQCEWLAEAIRTNIEGDELRHDDIIVINPDPVSTRSRVGHARRRLLDMGIASHLAGVDTDPDVFFQPGGASVTFTGVFRAKGNEAAMVYIVNAQDCHAAAFNLARIRNRLFTAITRSKAWVRVLGVGDGMSALIAEFERLRGEGFELRFRYPTREQREQLQIVHRDMSRAEREKLRNREQSLSELVSDLETGKVFPEDLDSDLLTKLERILKERRD